MEQSNLNSKEAPFHEAADRVSKRLLLCRMLEAVKRSALLFTLISIALLVVIRSMGQSFGGWVLALGLVALWLLGCIAWAVATRPSGFSVLALWDEVTGRHEAFASAFFFEKKPEMRSSERLHWEKNREQLEPAMASLGTDLPLPHLSGRWLLPALLIAFALSPLLQPRLEAGDALLSEEMIAAAEEEARRLAEREGGFDKMDSLTEEEKDEIDKLQKEIGNTADDLRRSSEKTAREVLRELEERARAAEKLAERMGSQGEEWASEEMLEEMGKHADTADLASEIKDRGAERTAEESDRVAKKLKEPDLSREVEERVTTALSRIMKKATAEDHKRAVGRHVGSASDSMKEEKAKAASREFERLADHFRRVAERERAQEKLRKLAEELRQSGSNIAGKDLQSMKKLAGNKGSSSQQVPSGMSQQPNQNLTPMNLQNMPGSGQGQPMPMPGMKPGKGGKQMTFAPVPGGAKGKPVALIPGAGQKPGGAGMMAPIPGTGGSGGQMAGQGGLQAGNGTAPMDENATNAMEAARSGLVGAQANADGESALRAVEGGERTELAERERQEQIVEFIKVEEEALDEATLPLSRKEHVLRYFTELRSRFEEER